MLPHGDGIHSERNAEADTYEKQKPEHIAQERIEWRLHPVILPLRSASGITEDGPPYNSGKDPRHRSALLRTRGYLPY